MTHHGPNSRDATTIFPIVYSAFARKSGIRMALFPGTPQSGVSKLSRFGLSGLWDFVAPRPDLGSGRGLNRTCSPQREFSNAIWHSRGARRKQVDSRLLVVGSQTGSLTPGPSFAHNLGFRCPNDQCEAILNIYTSRPFQ
jgi:hypothetical protein